MKHYDVVAAVIRHEGKYLCMMRGATRWSYTSFRWEFPGGKIEEGETPQEALKREISEEMEMNITVGQHLCRVEHTYPDFSITLNAYLCEANDPSFACKEHAASVWLAKEALDSLIWAPADVNIVYHLTHRFNG